MAGGSNSTLLGQASNASGSGTSNSTLAPANDISGINPGFGIYVGGGTTTTHMGTQKGGTDVLPLSQTSPTSTETVTQLLNDFYTQIANNQQALQQFATEVELAGMVKSGATQEELYAAWQKLIVQSYNHSINGQDVSPWDVLANSIPGGKQGSFSNNQGYNYLTGITSQQLQDIASNAASKSTNNTTQKTSVDINYTDPDTARYLANQAYQQMDGRQATNAEIAAFTRGLNANEAKFPKMSQTTETTSGSTSSVTGSGTTVAPTGAGSGGQTIVGYDNSGNPIYGPTDTSNTSTSTAKNVTDTNIMLGEADYTRYGREQLAQDYAKSAPDYGAYQAAGPLFQTFLNALKAPVSNIGSNS